MALHSVALATVRFSYGQGYWFDFSYSYLLYQGGATYMMTKNRQSVYNRSWYDHEIKFDKKRRRKEYNRRVRHMKIDENACSRGYIKQFRRLEWNTIS